MDRDTIAQELAQIAHLLGETGPHRVNELTLIMTQGTLTEAQRVLLEEREWWEKAAHALWEHESAVKYALTYKAQRPTAAESPDTP